MAVCYQIICRNRHYEEIQTPFEDLEDWVCRECKEPVLWYNIADPMQEWSYVDIQVEHTLGTEAAIVKLPASGLGVYIEEAF